LPGKSREPILVFLFFPVYLIADNETMLDFTTCVVYRSAYDELQDAREELDDAPEFDRKECHPA
jgi:hypothetical protein